MVDEEGQEPEKKDQETIEAFTIMPINCILRPGQFEFIEFFFNAIRELSVFEALASCEVKGETEYNIKLLGESSVIKFDFSTLLVDFGDVQFNDYGLGEF